MTGTRSTPEIRLMLEMRASHHIILATEMLNEMGHGERIRERVSHAQCNQALALGARAHIDMARFKLDHPGVMQKINYGRPNTED
jgi:hypothetical protein